MVKTGGARRKKRKSSYWIQDSSFKKNALRNQLRIPKYQKIPCTFLKEIVSKEIGDKAHNPTQTGIDSITVTRLVKIRAVNALKLKRMAGNCT
jgi:hypothetical protein